MKRLKIYSILILTILLMMASCASVEVRAVRKGDLEELQKYIAGGGDPNAYDGGQALLHIAVEYGQYQSLVFLLDHGAFPDLPDSRGATPLHLAVGKGRMDMIETLLTRGADVSRQDNNSQNMLFYAARSGQDNSLELLLSRGVNPRQLDSLGRTPLHFLDKNDRRNFAERLLSSGTDPAARESSTGDTALHVAARSGAFELADLYIRSSGPGLVGIKNSQGSGALFLSLNPAVSLQPGLRTMEVLLDNGADPNEPGRNRILPLQVAVEKLDAPRVELLLRYGARTDIRLERDATLLHLAVQREDEELTALLLRYGMDPNAGDTDGRTPVFTAASQNNPAVFRLLLGAGADLNRYDNQGITPFTLALMKSADRNEGLTDQARVMNQRNAPLSRRQDPQYQILFRTMETGNIEVANLLFNRGLNPNYSNAEGQTLIIRAVMNQKIEMLRILILNRASLELQDNRGRTALMYAAERPDVGIVRLLLQGGANVFAADRTGNTPIHFASRQGFPEPLRAILLAGANPNQSNGSGQTPYVLAESNPRKTEIQEILRISGADVPVTAAPVNQPPAQRPAAETTPQPAAAADTAPSTPTPAPPQPPAQQPAPETTPQPPAATDTASSTPTPAPQTPGVQTPPENLPADAETAAQPKPGDEEAVSVSPEVQGPGRPDIRLKDLIAGAEEPRGLGGPRRGFEGYTNQLASRYPRNMVSRENPREIQLYIVNESPGLAEIFIVQADGSPAPVYRLVPGGDVTLETRQGNVFVIYGANGEYFGDIATTGQELQGCRLLPREN